MRPTFDEEWFFGEIKKQLQYDAKMLKQLVEANQDKEPSSFSTTRKEILRNFPTELPGGVKIDKRRFVRLVRRACKEEGWHVIVNGNVLRASLRGGTL